MTSFHGLAANMRRTAKTVGTKASDAVKVVAEAVGVTVVYGTPVDTSRARMNWQGSVGTPKEGVLSPAPAAPDSSAEGPRVAIESIRAATREYTGQPGGVWIVNNLDYIGELNDGSSSQAPQDFVAKATLAGVNAVSKVKLLP